jgi:hypothetical protein
METAIRIIIMIAAYFIGQALAPKPQKPKPVALEDIEFPQVDEGTPQEVIFGDCWTESWQVLWYGNYRTTEIRRKSGK